VGIGSVILASMIGPIVWYVSFLFISIFSSIAAFKLSIEIHFQEDPYIFG
jgi:hypothetical protein